MGMTLREIKQSIKFKKDYIDFCTYKRNEHQAQVDNFNKEIITAKQELADLEESNKEIMNDIKK